jgi:hypothetical protein
MTPSSPTPNEIEREFRRVGITWRTFAELVRENRGLNTAPQGFAISIGPETWDLLRSLPDGAGHDAFIKAFKAQFRGGEAGA